MPTNAQKQVAKKIRLALKERGKSAERLALELGMSSSFLYAFLNGRKGITLETLVRIADGLDLKLKDLMPD